ncbi:hypothetical protein [Amycolatopsis orientalis]|uniref:hypothetical protein n=1 Tax=Amycolatopsis orientalis TaxID=31958 RepID=UPI000ADC11A9
MNRTARTREPDGVASMYHSRLKTSPKNGAGSRVRTRISGASLPFPRTWEEWAAIAACF